MNTEKYVKGQLADTSTYKCVPHKNKDIQEDTEEIRNWTIEFKEELSLNCPLNSGTG